MEIKFLVGWFIEKGRRARHLTKLKPIKIKKNRCVTLNFPLGKWDLVPAENQ